MRLCAPAFGVLTHLGGTAVAFVVQVHGALMRRPLHPWQG